MLLRLMPCALFALCFLPLYAPAQAGEDPAPAVALDQVDDGEHFPGDAPARAMLERQGFVVLPRFHKQIFSPYIGGKLPYYVTVDSAHRTYHVIF
ncbi:MAG: hypothetical protein QNJ90_13940, partial [Planctomycetota bacterium]|nr:hypothetical protein [Planctomycetota bacterium]